MAVQKSSAPMCVNCVQSLNLCGKWPLWLSPRCLFQPCPKLDWTSYCMSATSPCHGCSLWARLRNCGSEQELKCDSHDGQHRGVNSLLLKNSILDDVDVVRIISHASIIPFLDLKILLHLPSGLNLLVADETRSLIPWGQDPSLCSTRTKQIQICFVLATQPEKCGKRTIKNNLTFVRGSPEFTDSILMIANFIHDKWI